MNVQDKIRIAVDYYKEYDRVKSNLTPGVGKSSSVEFPVFENLEDSRVRLLVSSGIDGGARTVATAEFAVVGNPRFSNRLCRRQ